MVRLKILKDLHINLHHHKVASDEFLLSLEQWSFDIALVKETWLVGSGKVSGLSTASFH